MRVNCSSGIFSPLLSDATIFKQWFSTWYIELTSWVICWCTSLLALTSADWMVSRPDTPALVIMSNRGYSLSSFLRKGSPFTIENCLRACFWLFALRGMISTASKVFKTEEPRP